MLAHRMILVLALLGFAPARAWATWSIVAVDRDTARIVVASATCVPLEEPRSLKSVQAVVVPGVGAAACQALIDGSGRNQSLVFEELRKGSEPSEILRLLRVDPNLEQRQFGIVDMRGRTAGFSGAKNGRSALDRQGRAPGTEIFYSIQGNILRSDAVVTSAVQAFVATQGALTDRVMAAMEAADRAGGDSRCTCATPPNAAAPCDGKTSHVAYILMAEKDDPLGRSFNDGTYALYLSVTQSNIQPSENANPVKTLRMRYDAWRKTQPDSFR